jgi:cytochrome c oxidase cbb3-type subunit III
MKPIPNHKALYWILFVAACCCAPCALNIAQQNAPTEIRHGLWHEYPTAQVEAGRVQFQKTCAFCHGPDANGGDTGPNLMRSNVVRHDEKGNLIGQVIRNGFPDKGMPAFQLSSDEIMNIVAFLSYRLDESDRRSPRHAGADYSAAKLLVGNAQAGKAFFDGAGKCSTCHSPEGDMKEIASKYPATELQAMFLYPKGQHPTATVIDASGKEYSGRIRLLTRYDIAIVDGEGWYHSWPIHSVKVQLHDPLEAHRQLLFKFTDSDMHNIFAYLETLK